MNATTDEERHQETLEGLKLAIEQQDDAAVSDLIESLHPAEVASLLESLPLRDRDIVWEQLDAEQHGDVLAEAEDAVRAQRMVRMDAKDLAVVATGVDVDDAADILQDLPSELVEEVLQAMDDQDRRRLESVLEYAEDTAGGLMDTDVITVRADVTLETVARYLRRRGEIPEKTNRLMVVDRDNRFVGVVRLADLLINDPSTVVNFIMDAEFPAIPARLTEHEVAMLFEQRDLISAPVIDDDGRLLGRITVDDVVDVIRDEGEHSLMSMAGLDEEEDMFAPVLDTARARALWLGVNLATALLASWVIGWFEGTLRQVVALAILMPVVASMGGIAGSQALTVVIRGMALGQVGWSNAGFLMLKELMVASLNSIVWALLVGAVAVAWFGDLRLGLIVGAALVINLMVAALSGAGLPLVLKKLSIDPALAGGVILTTVTDVVGFVVFLGLGTAFLLA
ncbi:MAG: magnesium transporter [Gammaproteobacteria bacterium]|nr:magnesium transporter [Gammaproteobacteria bacterium]